MAVPGAVPARAGPWANNRSMINAPGAALPAGAGRGPGAGAGCGGGSGGAGPRASGRWGARGHRREWGRGRGGGERAGGGVCVGGARLREPVPA